MHCNYCDNSAVYHRRISNEYVCKQHFIKTIEKKILKTVRKYRMFSANDKLVVGISGGKDSLVVLYNVLQIQKHRQSRSDIHAILIDEGIKGYREESLAIAEEFCHKWNVPLHIVKFQEEFGATLDECIKNIKNLSVNACTICGTVRRRLLNAKARELGADYLVIGHNLDDQAETLLQNILRNDLTRIIQHPPWGNKKDETGIFIPRVKPLMEIPESEITLYCYYKGFPIQTTPCPYVEPYFILRKNVQTFLNQLEKQSAEIKYNLIRFHENAIKMAFHSNIDEDSYVLTNTSKDLDSNPIHFCRICKEPSGPSRDLCYYCYLKSQLGLDTD
ncbi:MAG: adenine nucleotide alpha hydrolase family protein [Candidatus Lokiarchaeota archaeon]|nr:adenine nucleotide alpha hydrolase family protein [Candidatus Harpocratesius repetitus]